jgi:hypothetical protein
MPKAYLIAGSESSGTRLLAKILVKCGVYGQYTHKQEIDKYLNNLEKFLQDKEDVVLRRSFPHANAWPDLESIIEKFRQVGYTPIVIVPLRDWKSTISSQISRHKHVSTYKKGLKNIQEAYLRILSAIKTTNVEYYIVDFQALLHYQEVTLQWLTKECGLKYKPVDFIDKKVAGKWLS